MFDGRSATGTVPRITLLNIVEDFNSGWMVRASNSGAGEIFRTLTDRPWGPPSLLYDGYRVSFPGDKAAGAWR